MKLNQYEILSILKIEKISDKNTGIYDINFEQLLNKLSLEEKEKQLITMLYKKEYAKCEIDHINKIAILLSGKIETFSDDFWELFFFRKNNNSSFYDNKKWVDLNQRDHCSKIVKRRVDILKSLFISLDQCENFITKLQNNTVEDKYLDLWFDLKKKSKDKNLNLQIKNILKNYGRLDPNDYKKAKMLSYFKEVEELEKLYELNKDSIFKRHIENELLKLKKINIYNLELMNDDKTHAIIYRKTIIINENAIIYDYNINIKKSEKMMNIINVFIRREMFDIKHFCEEKKHVYTFECYSEVDLIRKVEIFKNIFKYLPDLMIKKNYIELINDNVIINNDVIIFFRQYIKSAEMQSILNDKLPLKNNISTIKVKI